MRIVRELNLYPIVGLYQELYNPDFLSMSEPLGNPDGIDMLKNINSCFWSEILSENTIDRVIKLLEIRQKYIPDTDFKIKAVLKKPHFFKKQLTISVGNLATHSLSPQEFFSYLETLKIYCSVYSDFVSAPYRLSIEDGFDLDESNFDNLLRIACTPAINPYYDFLQRQCKEIIRKAKPQIVWLRGKLRISTLTLALFVKQIVPEAHISVVGHSSEYYSLNKIVEYLKMNKQLFSVIDSIILDDENSTIKQLYNCIKDRLNLSSVYNLLYIDKSDGEIKQTPSRITKQTLADWTVTRRQNTLLSTEIAASEVVNLKLWPNSRCFWNKCTFCGINKKYDNSYGDRFLNVDEVVNHVERMANQGVHYFWFIDEAIPPTTIMEFSQKILDKGICIYWQIRSRIDYDYKGVDFDLLYQAGLREIRLGLESANSRIRKLMNKFPRDISNSYIENLVARFNKSGISVHFPMIIGFPTETAVERYETYEFLKMLKQKYALMSFNINILGLDVSSDLFKNYTTFNISEIKFPCAPENFIGNLVDWDCSKAPFNRAVLDAERNSFMRQVLYPWMPKNCSMPVYIYYRLSETSRNTLIWKQKQISVKAEEIDADTVVRLNDGTSIVNQGSESVQVYSLSSHHLIECTYETTKLLKYLSRETSIREAINYMIINYENPTNDWNTYLEQIQTLYELGFLEIISYD